jgi:SAM-dependent methyltransferase
MNNMSKLESGSTTPVEFDVPLGCPLCRKALAASGRGRILCPPCEREDCPKEFRLNGGFPDLVVGERFGDATSDELLANEERNTQHAVREYWTPLFKAWQKPGEKLRILAVGCGAGAEVDLLRDVGFECVGIDNGNRVRSWSTRRSRHSLAMANAMRLPFSDGSFDVAFCGCVFPHVGVVGDSSTPSETCWDDRLAVAREMTRVMRPGGQIVVSSPNRWFPLDLFHGRAIGSFRTPLNPPWRKFLLAAGDYRRLFLEAGCSKPAIPLSIKNYWGFCRTNETLKGRLAALPVKALLQIGSHEATRPLRTSGLVPWIVMLIGR